MTKTSSGKCSGKRREIFGCSVIWEKNFELLRRDLSTGGTLFIDIVASPAEPDGVHSSSDEWVLKSELDPELSVSWRSAASSRHCSPPWYTLYWEPCHPNLAQWAAPPSPAHSSTEQEVPIPGTACESGSSAVPAPPSSSDFPSQQKQPTGPQMLVYCLVLKGDAQWQNELSA